MYNIYKAIHHRMEKFLMASSSLSADASAGAFSLQVEDASYFGFEGLIPKIPYVAIMDDNTTGLPTADAGFEGVELIQVSRVDTDTNTIFFETALENNWTTADNALIQRAPGETIIRKVVIGDLAVINDFPAVCVVPTNESLDWWTMPGGTKETVSIDFMVYVSEGDTETATEDLLKVTSVIKWILMSNLHIQVKGASSVYGVTSKAIVSNIDYGVIQKGSEFLKAGKLTWTGELYVLRDYMYQQSNALYEGD